jgi:hypothetical protein
MSCNGYLKLGTGSNSKREADIAYGNEITDGVRGRVAIRKSQADGYIESALVTQRAVGGENSFSLKGALQWDLNSNLQLDVIYKC